MKQQWSGMCAAALLAAAATIGAQVQIPSPTNTPPADANQRPGTQKAIPEPGAQGRTPNTTVVTGCLQSAPLASAGFILANPRMTAEGDAPPGGRAVGTTGASASASYRLEGDEKLISPHLNHEVEIKGWLQTAATPAAGAPTAAGGSAPPMATLKVESVEMIAAACPPAAATAPRAEPALPAEPAQPARPVR